MIVSVLIMFPILRKVGKSLSEHRLLPVSFMVLGIAMGLMAMDFPIAGIGVLLMVYFLGFNLLEASIPSLLSRISGSRGRGRRMGVYSTFQFLGAFAGGVLGGGLLGWLGSGTTLLIAAVACLIWGIVLKAMSKRFFLTSPGH